LKLTAIILGASLIVLSSCDKCYLCYNPAKKYEQELCGSGKKINGSIKEAEDAGWECSAIEE